ncbi:MAG TPA: S24 family peptidase [Hyphomonadaceae bacterium]|nr:S24 family peptidase [Hyphomonadaceae bacterium]
MRVRYLFQMGDYKGDNTTGFQSPAQDYVEDAIDLAAILDLRRPGRYPVRVKGQALASRGIRDGDILVADAAAEPKPGKVCVAMVGGDVILATLTKRDDVWVLVPSSGPIITIADDVEVWAIVQALVRTQL